MAEPDDFVTLVQCVAEKCFAGKLPENSVVFIAAMLATFLPETIPQDLAHMLPVNLWPAVQDNFAQGLTVAADCLARSQEARWTN